MMDVKDVYWEIENTRHSILQNNNLKENFNFVVNDFALNKFVNELSVMCSKATGIDYETFCSVVDEDTVRHLISQIDNFNE